MYELYCGLSEQPFGLTPDTEFFYQTVTHKAARSGQYRTLDYVQRQMQASVSRDPPRALMIMPGERLTGPYTAIRADTFFLIYQLVSNQY
jgi:hypothetical protein